MNFKEKVLFVILDDYSDREYPLLADALQFGIENRASQYEVKTLSVTKQAVRSIGGFTTIPDYCVDDMPLDYAGLVLIGGYSWETGEARQLIPIVKNAYTQKKVVAAICKATEFLGNIGLLNEYKHTSNTLETLELSSGKAYTGKRNYVSAQVVRDNKLITANGTAYLEFAREVLFALNAYPADYIERYYNLYKKWIYRICQNSRKHSNIQVIKWRKNEQTRKNKGNNEKDKQHDGKFYYGVKTTKIVCNPSCPAKLPLEKNIVLFDALEEAIQGGYRPCKICMKNRR